MSKLKLHTHDSTLSTILLSNYSCLHLHQSYKIRYYLKKKSNINKYKNTLVLKSLNDIYV